MNEHSKRAQNFTNRKQTDFFLFLFFSTKIHQTQARSNEIVTGLDLIKKAYMKSRPDSLQTLKPRPDRDTKSRNISGFCIPVWTSESSCVWGVG